MDVTDEELEAVASYIRLVELSLREFPNEPVGGIFDCGCMGPMPECRCMKRDRLVKSFLAKIGS